MVSCSNFDFRSQTFVVQGFETENRVHGFLASELIRSSFGGGRGSTRFTRYVIARKGRRIALPIRIGSTGCPFSSGKRESRYEIPIAPTITVTKNHWNTSTLIP